jgi:hypothetical protein
MRDGLRPSVMEMPGWKSRRSWWEVRKGASFLPFSQVLTYTMGEWISKAIIVTYTDDTTVYFWGRTGGEVREGLEMAAKEVLEYMKATQLAANEEKTGFLMFG